MPFYDISSYDIFYFDKAISVTGYVELQVGSTILILHNNNFTVPAVAEAKKQ